MILSIQKIFQVCWSPHSILTIVLITSAACLVLGMLSPDPKLLSSGIQDPFPLATGVRHCLGSKQKADFLGTTPISQMHESQMHVSQPHRFPGYNNHHTLLEWLQVVKSSFFSTMHLGEQRLGNWLVGIDVGRDCCIRDKDIDPLFKQISEKSLPSAKGYFTCYLLTNSFNGLI